MQELTNLSIVKSAVKNEADWYSVKEICDICNTSRQSWINFKNDSNCKTGFTVRRNLKEWFVLTKEKLNEIVNKYEFIQSSY